MIDIKNKINGKYRVEVVSTDGTVRYPFGEKFRNNLVLNSGLNSFATSSTAPNFFAYCRAGTGNTVPAVTDVTLVNQTKSTSSVEAGSSFNGTAYDVVLGKATHKKTFIFAAETVNTNYSEVGFSWLSGALDPLFSRVVFPGVVTVLTGERLRIVWQVEMVNDCVITPKVVTGSSGSFDASGQIKVVGTLAAIYGSMSSTGVFTVPFAIMYGSGNCQWQMSTNSTFPAVNVTPTITNIYGPTLGTYYVYTQDSFTRTYAMIASEAQPVNTISTLRSVFFSAYSGGSTARIQYLFDSAQTKQNTHKLDLRIRTSWTRG